MSDKYIQELIRAKKSADKLRARAMPLLPMLISTARGDTGGSRACRALLLGLYNGTSFPFDLSELSVLDKDHFDAAMLVIEMDARAKDVEIHKRIPEAEKYFRAWTDAGNTGR